LRREEVAQRAEISIEWYTKLEQGRVVLPSAGTLQALAKALELTDVEERHLRRLVNREDRPLHAIERVPDGVRRVIENLSGPAYVTGKRWDILAWNSAAARLFGFELLAADQRNILLFVMTNPASRTLFGATWAIEAKRMVSLFRADYDVWAGDPSFEQLIDQCQVGCPQFKDWWQSHDVGAPASGTKHLHHPVDGDHQYAYSTFHATDDPALKLALYSKHT
jgi:transcriptional regulator with XRE-family HTH domain